MFEWVLNTPLILLKLLSLSTICEEAYSEPSQAFGMDDSGRVYIYICNKIICELHRSKVLNWRSYHIQYKLGKK